MFHDPKNQEYLDLCLRSLNYQDVDKEVILVDSSIDGHKSEAYPWLKTVKVDNSTNSAVAGNIGFRNASSASKYFLFANDDTIFTVGSVAELMGAMGENRCIMNAFSNCDTEWLHWREMSLYNEGKSLVLPRFFDMNLVRGFEQQLIEYPLEKRTVIPVPYVCFYATIMPQSVWWDVGQLDENFESGPDDRDFCMRAAKLGIPSMINLGPTIWHFGGTTVNSGESEHVKQRRLKNAKYFYEKHGVHQ